MHTIHTMQGKESAVVILVLGGRSDNAGARNWVVSEPNLSERGGHAREAALLRDRRP